MNGVEKIIVQNMVNSLRHCQKVFRSLGERGRFPQELCPFDLNGHSVEDHPSYLGVQGFHFIEVSIKAAEELLRKEG